MSEAGHNLHREIEAARALLANMADIIGDDVEFARDVVEGQTSLNEAIDQAVWLLAADVAHIKGLNEYIDKMTARKERLQARVENTRIALAAAMEQAGKKKLEHPAVTLSLRPTPPSVVLTDEALIPAKFWVASDPKLSKKAVGDALKAKETVPGATLSNGGVSLTLTWS